MDLHLVSMPVYDPMQPSAQTGYLQGHVEKQLGADVTVHTYPAHLSIFFAWKGEDMRSAFNDHRLHGEELFYLACMRAFQPSGFAEAYAAYEAGARVHQRVTVEEIDALCLAVDQFVFHELMPALNGQHLNVIGFTTTFAQLFASVYAARRLLGHAKAPMLLVFGGASVNLPEHQRLLAEWGIRGLLIQGPGEIPLVSVLRSAARLDADQWADAPDVLAAAGIRNVSAIGTVSPIELGYSKEEMREVPEPIYDAFFEQLREYCPSEGTYRRLLSLTSLPVEGSRGCFAKCDFCQNPNITANFASLTGGEVARRALGMSASYGVGKIFFADSVCNSWAEAYADTLAMQGHRLPAFMEMRVHAEESFFAKLARVGVSEMQLGVEALSEPLLKAMRKGTTVWQNLRAAKYLAELGIESASNLITHHPKSTMEDVAATRSILTRIPHFPGFSLSYFVVSYASPLYLELDAQDQESLPRGFDWLPASMRHLTTNRDLAYPYPREWLPPPVREGWDEFLTWHAGYEAERKQLDMRLTVLHEEGDELVIERQTARDSRRFLLKGARAAVLSHGHAAPKLPDLAARLALDEQDVEHIVRELEGDGLVLRLADRALSLPLRPRETLISRIRERTAPATAGRVIALKSM